MDGYVIIKTKIDDSGIEKDLDKIEKTLDAATKKAKSVKVEIDSDGLSDFEKAVEASSKATNGLTDELQRLYDQYRELNSGNIKFESDIKQAEELKKKIIQVIKQIEKLTGEKFVIKGINDKETKGAFDGIGKSIKGITKKIAMWGLALFGIRSAYMGIRTAINQVSQYNKDVANTLTYAKSMISTALEPVVIQIVQWLKTALGYINQLFKVWFKRDLFAETDKNLKKANKSARELKKTLTGFDEMNILNSPSTGGGGGVSSADLNIPDTEATGLFGWILNNKDKVLGALAAISAGLIALRLSGFDPLVGIFGAITGFGIYKLISGIIELIQNPSWEAFGKTLAGLGFTIGGIAGILAVIGVATGPIGWIIGAIGLVVGGIGLLIEELGKNKTAINETEKAMDNLIEAQGAYTDAELAYIRAVKQRQEAREKLNKIEKETKENGKELYEQIKNTGMTYENLTDNQKKVYEAYLNLLSAQEKEHAALEKSKTASTDLTNATEDMGMTAEEVQESYKKLRDEMVTAYESGERTATEVADAISKIMAKMDTETMIIFAKDIPDAIKSSLDPFKYKNDLERFRAQWNGEIAKFNKEIKVKVTFQDTTTTPIAVGKLITSWKANAKGAMYYPKLPKLAVGGIINQPGRGVPYHNSIIAERGAEAVLPLTDSQQMGLLGEAIGRNVNIVATVPVYVGNRMVAKELKRINAEDDFAFNR